MPHRVVLTEKAEADIDAVLRWFHDQRAIAAGSRWLQQVMRTVDTLATHPERCPLAEESDELGQVVREILVGRQRFKYRVLFKIDGKELAILHVRHSSRGSIAAEDLSI